MFVDRNNNIEQVAYKHSVYLSQIKKLSHRGRHNSTPGDRLRQNKYVWEFCAENVAFGANFDEKSLIDAWMGSPIHCKNLMEKKYTEIGLAQVNNYWVLVLAKPLD